MPTNSPPSVILTDALASLNKAVNIAFASIQDQARQEVTQASTEGREARRERDEAVKALHECRLEEQAWRQETGVWKAAVEQAELTIKHHLDTISQLRHEAEQWKQQCLRLEDTSRQEAISWKEQFLRVEQERYKLATRVDELVEDQLSYTSQAHASNTPITPMLCHSSATTITSHPDSSISTRVRRSPYAFLDDSSSSSISKAIKPTSAQQLPTPISENRRATGDKPKQFLIRRVQATIEVPVKEESEDQIVSDKVQPASCSSASSLSSGPAFTSKRPSTSTNASKTIPTSKATAGPISKATPGSNKPASATSKAAPGRNKPVLVCSKSTLTSGKSAPGPSKSTARSSKPMLSGTGNKIPSTSTPASSRPARKVSAKRPYVEIDDGVEEDEMSEPSGSGSDANVDDVDTSEDEDELMMGAEENRREVYGTKRIMTATSSMKALSSAPAKKRKLASNTTALTSSAGKKPPAKNARG